MMALQAETDESVNKNYEYKFGDNIFTFLKQCKQIVEKSNLLKMASLLYISTARLLN